MLCHFLINILFTHILIAKNIQDLLTQNHTRLWLRNKTQIADPENPYCSICCIDINQIYKGRKCGIHTMCVYAARPIGPSCTGLIVMNFSRNEIDAIVDAHNTIRNRVAMGQEQTGNPGPQPSAANMKMISWDSELARTASLWAQQCVFSHDKCRDLDRFPVGQNIARGTYAMKTDLEHVADWYDWVQFSTKKIIEKYNIITSLDGLALYTQLIWADTYLIGCARVSFQKLENGQVIYREHFFCNYGPSGNIPQQSVYKIGEPCSACSEGTFCTNPEYPGLCGNEILNETYLRSAKKKRAEESDGNHSNGKSLIIIYFNSFIILLLFQLLFLI